MSDYSSFCLSCFTQNPAAQTGKKCPTCGFRESPRKTNMFLPYRTLLNNQYLVGRELGAGGFGITYLALDIALLCPVAIKEFFPRDLMIRENGSSTLVPTTGEARDFFAYGLDKFLEEARIMARFNHPNIVRVRNFFSANGTGYIVMDYYRGMHIEALMGKRGGRLDEQETLNIIMPILDGLERIHQRDFLHRDIKPQNIYITDAGMPILLDFGAARWVTGQKTRSLTVVLTPGFAPFEQYRTQGDQGPWTDIYSLCASIYFVLTGLVPKVAPERMNNDTMVPVEKLVPGLSPHFSEAIARGLALKISDRIQSVSQLREILQSPYIGQRQPGLLQRSESLPDKPSPAARAPETTLRNFTFTCISGDYQGSILQLTPNSPLSIGRDPKTVNLYIADPKISRVHTQVWADENMEGVWVADCKSLNGTYYFSAFPGPDILDWLPIDDKFLLKPGDQFRLGSNENIFQIGEEFGRPGIPVDEDKTGILVDCPSCGLKNVIQQDQPLESAVCTGCWTPLISSNKVLESSEQSSPLKAVPPPQPCRDQTPAKSYTHHPRQQLQAAGKSSYTWIYVLTAVIVIVIIVLATS